MRRRRKIRRIATVTKCYLTAAYFLINSRTTISPGVTVKGSVSSRYILFLHYQHNYVSSSSCIADANL